MTAKGESRLARWSRLKAKGGADAADNAVARDVNELPSPDANDAGTPFADMPDPANLPGGVQNRTFAPPMPALAGEEDDVSYDPHQAPAPAEALAMLNGETPAAGEGADGLDVVERELTPEEAEVLKNLPPLDSLDQDSDFTPFLADNVPEFIRNRALKILWRSNPLFGFQDGLDDYALNYRVIDKLITVGTDSIYRPGKGYAIMDEADEADEAAEANVADDEVAADDGATPAAESNGGGIPQEAPVAASGPADPEPADAAPGETDPDKSDSIG